MSRRCLLLFVSLSVNLQSSLSQQQISVTNFSNWVFLVIQCSRLSARTNKTKMHFERGIVDHFCSVSQNALPYETSPSYCFPLAVPNLTQTEAKLVLLPADGKSDTNSRASTVSVTPACQLTLAVSSPPALQPKKSLQHSINITMTNQQLRSLIAELEQARASLSA